MDILAITQGGFGDVWSVDTRTNAWLHPLVQYGDAILGGAEELSQDYSRLEWPAICRLAGVTLTELDHRWLAAESARDARRVMEKTRDAVWSGLVAAARPLPDDPATICETISRDRRLTTMAKKNPAPAPAESKTETAAAAPAAKGGPRGVPQDAIIRMQPDPKDASKIYGPDHNPKRSGSAGHARFALYKDGMTVREAIDAGIWAADITWDKDKGFIKVEGGTAKAAAPAPAAPAAEAPATEATAEGPAAESTEAAAA